jgi:hypothetical protein
MESKFLDIHEFDTQKTGYFILIMYCFRNLIRWSFKNRYDVSFARPTFRSVLSTRGEVLQPFIKDSLKDFDLDKWIWKIISYPWYKVYKYASVFNFGKTAPLWKESTFGFEK